MPSARVPVAPSRRLLRSLAVASALACSAVVSAVLPGAVASAAEADTVLGELVQAVPDREHAGGGDHEDSGPLAWVESADGDAVRVPAEDVAGIPAGSTVELTVGAQVEDPARAEDGIEPARAVLASDVIDVPEPVAPRPDAAGLTNQVTVVLVTPGGAARDGVTEQQLVSVVDGPVADFWSEQTGGAVRIGVTASHGWISTAAGCSNPAALWNEVAGSVGFAPGPGRHLLLHVSRAAKDCSYALAEVGAATSTGGRMYVRDTIPSVIAHEFGHNFGLGHSSGRQCDGAIETGNCRTSSYRDFYDVMGFSWGQLGALNAAQAARLGVLPAPQQQALTTRGSAVSLTLAPLSGTGGTRALRLTDADGVDYWLEYRTGTGRDAWLDAPTNAYGLQAGVLLRRAGGLPDTSVLLDGTPTPAEGWDADLQAALPVGSTVPVAGGDFTVLVRSASTAGAVVDVVPSGAPPVASPQPVGPGAVPGTVMSGTVMSGAGAGAGGGAGAGAGGGPGAPAAPAAEEAAPAPHMPPAPGTASPRSAAPSIAAATRTTTGGWVAPAVGALLGGVALCAIRLARRPSGH
ncbi:MAG: reprolysin-like metallopeptidase [Actinomycetes bacterium]